MPAKRDAATVAIARDCRGDSHRGEDGVVRCAVVGAGAWARPSLILAENGAETALWAFERDVVASINDCHENPRFLPDQRLSSDVRATTDHAEALHGASFIVYATPSHHLRRIAKLGSADVRENAILTVATKGIEQGTLALMTTVIEQELPGRSVVGISGPSFAIEVAAHQPTAIVAASV